MLQVIAPLLLIFVGHAAVAREREAGTLRVLVAQGLRPGTLVLGKLLALGGVATAMLVPAGLALAWTALTTDVAGPLVLAMLASYVAWSGLWVVAVVVVSALCKRSRDALLVLMAIWVLTVVLLPRVASESAARVASLPTRIETEIAVTSDLAALGDSHNPDDPYFSDFRKKVLAQYGVSRIEDLPVNYKGLVGMEGERLTSELFNRYTRAGFAIQERQLAHADAFSLISPLLALRRLSMIAAGTDLHAYRRFLEQAERHRYELVQSLNRMQAEKLSFATDRSSRDNRIDKHHWHGLAEFHFEPEAPGDTLRRTLPLSAVLVAWLAAAAFLVRWSAGRLGGGAR